MPGPSIGRHALGNLTQMTTMQHDQSVSTDAAAPLAGPGLLDPSDVFVHRHIGPDDAEIQAMLEVIGLGSLDALAEAAVPADIRLDRDLEIDAPLSEHDALQALRRIAERNQVFRSCIGMGYSDCITPPVILRNVLENPGWYTAYTPYQAEIAQGRLEALLNFQTMVSGSHGSAAGERVAARRSHRGGGGDDRMCAPHRRRSARYAFFVAEHCHPQTIEVVRRSRRGAIGDRDSWSAPSPKTRSRRRSRCAAPSCSIPTTYGTHRR